MNKKRKAVIEQNEISEVATLTLGGYQQKVLIEGKSRSLPVLVFLHGGPGSPVPFGVGSRGLYPEFTDRFVMVYWDQLGSGINNRVIDDSFCIQNFVDMTVDLVREMKKRFPENRLILFGTSWGSVLTLKAAGRLGSEIDAAVTWGQFTNKALCGENAYSALENSSMPESKKQTVRSIKSGRMTPDGVKQLAGLLMKYTDGYINSSAPKMPMGAMALGLLTSPDYKLKDFIALFKNGTRKNESLWRELIDSDFCAELAAVPVRFAVLQGETDVVTDTQTVVEVVKNANNPNLTCRVVQNAGHIPGENAISVIIDAIESVAQDCA